MRFHLQKLLRLGMVEEIEERLPVGRPRLLYHATGKLVEMVFPPRSYLHLATLMVEAMLKDSDQDRVQEQLRKVGTELGTAIGEQLTEKVGRKNWGAEEFRKYFVEAALKEFGTLPKLVDHSDTIVQYRFNNCPFKELAQKYPELICEVLDDNIQIALCRKINPETVWKKLKCIGHGDSCCEFRVSWER